MAKIARRARHDATVMSNYLNLNANQRFVLEKSFTNAMVSSYISGTYMSARFEGP